MITRQLGQTAIMVSALGLGTWAMGGTWWGGTDEAEAVAGIQRALDEGVTLIDTAPAYGFGLAEELVGQAIRGRERSTLVIATKVGLVWHTEEGHHHAHVDGRHIMRNLRPLMIRHEIEQSLRRLGTDYIDLYQTHWQDPTTPIAETMGELLRLRDEGKIRAIGVSNASVAQMQEYLAVGRLDACQPKYNMLDRDIENDILPFCRAQQIAVLSYSSLGMGLLSGSMSPDRQFPEGDVRRGNPRFSPESIRRVNAMLARFAPIRDRYRLDQAQLSIAWTISRPGVTCALVGVRNAQQAAAIAPGGRVMLNEDTLAEMDRIMAASS